MKEAVLVKKKGHIVLNDQELLNTAATGLNHFPGSYYYMHVGSFMFADVYVFEMVLGVIWCEEKSCVSEKQWYTDKISFSATLFTHSQFWSNPSHVLGLDFRVCQHDGVSGMSGLRRWPTSNSNTHYVSYYWDVCLSLFIQEHAKSLYYK